MVETDPATAMKAQIRAELVKAMRAKAALKVAALRTVLAALDNAESVPVGTQHRRSETHGFGGPGTEVPRRILTTHEVQALVRSEITKRIDAAGQMDILGQGPQADRLREEALVLQSLDLGSAAL
ncbi:MAG: hypothetical protein RJA87_1535 [Pseudomonadota bacterium]|jgi:uncharacterized protein YqeY